MKNSLALIVQLLLQKNRIPFDNEELDLQIQSHPSYPSLHAITGVLEHFGIKNMAFDIPQNEEVYKELPQYFIAHIKNKQGEELVFIEKKTVNVALTYPNKKKEKLTISNFLKLWTGIIVVVEKEELATQNSISTNKLKLISVFLLGLSVIFLLNKTDFFSLNTSLQFVLSLIGTYIAYLLIKHELGVNSERVDKLCNQSEKTSCDAVLNSKAAMVFGLFKLSDVTFVYFLSLTVFWLVSSITILTNNIINTLGYLSIPVVLYSLYYQAVVVKKWCPLCLATASVLISQTLISYLLNPLSFNYTLKDFVMPTIISSIVVTLYSYIKPLLSKNIKLSKREIEYYTFKRNFSLFKNLHTQKPILNTKINKLQEIVFGNINALTELLVVTNPLCGYCKATHQAIDKLLINNSKNIKVTIRFNINAKNDKDTAYKIATILINLYQKDIIECKKAMHDIYTHNVDVNKWLKTHESYINTNQQVILETEQKWCVDNSVNFTPAVYLNQKEYPKEYDLSDLSLFLDDIVEEQSIKNVITRRHDEIIS